MFLHLHGNTVLNSISMKKVIILFAICVLTMDVLYAQKKIPDIDLIVDKILYGSENGMVKNHSIIGASIGVYWNGKTNYYCYGMADKEKNIKVDTNTLFEI